MGSPDLDKRILRSVPVAILLTVDRKITWFNPAVLDLTGYPEEELLGISTRHLIPAPDDYERIGREAYDASGAVRRNGYQTTLSLRRKDGQWCQIRLSAQPLESADSPTAAVWFLEDITEREIYYKFFNEASDLMCVVGADGHFKRLNPAFARTLGYSNAVLLSRPLSEFIHPDDRQSTADEIARLFRDAIDTKGYENRYLCADGSSRWLSWRAYVNREDGQIYATARDVTEQKKAAQSLSILWQAVEQSPDSIVITDAAGNIEYVNRAFTEITGYGRDQVRGQNPRLLQSGLTPAVRYEEMWATLTNGENWEGELVNRRRDGSNYTELARISPVRQADGRIIHFLAIKHDISEQKRTAETILEAKILLQRVIDAMPDWIYVKDREHRFLLVNEAFANAMQQTPGSMIGQRDSDLIQLFRLQENPPEGIQKFHADDDAVFAGESIHHPNDLSFFNNNEGRVFDTYKIPMRDSTLGIYGVLCYRRDITESYRQGQEQRAVEKQLRQAQKMEVIGHMTGGIAHDFNNILAAMFGFAELAQMSPVLKQDPKLSKYLLRIMQSGARARELVSQLLAFSQKSDASIEPILVGPVIKEVISLLKSTLPSNITIKKALPQDLPSVLISSVHLHQILMNLGVNARDAMAGNGVLEIAASRTAVDQPFTCDSCHQNFSGDYLVISLKDSGSGITPEHLTMIFDPFFTTKPIGQGSGLGLSVLHGLVHSAQGHIQVLSNLGSGTEFRIFLPAETPRSELPPVDSTAPVEAVHLLGRVWVIDDEPAIVEFMSELLEGMGCAVTGLTATSEALRLFTSDPHSVDLVITDQTMPELTGLELARHMLARRPQLPIVLCTGYSRQVDEESAQQIGIRRFLKKPVPATLLGEIVTEYLSQKPPHS
ncbi:MAG: putative hybrid sensor and regulator protein [Proteobacteria bacterium]|nr:putative hybrid sensor and regulator protein [Pseudomonadota bacterium]